VPVARKNYKLPDGHFGFGSVGGGWVTCADTFMYVTDEILSRSTTSI
jgi:hypothetical protein